MIDVSATIGEGITIGTNVVIEEEVMIGNHVTIGSNVMIKAGTIICDDVSIHDYSVLGQNPSSNHSMRKTSENLSPLIIGNQVKLGSHCVIYRGSQIMDHVFIGDFAGIREGVSIGEETVIGRNVMIENHTEIGKKVTIQTSSYVTAYMRIEDDVFIGPCFSSSNDKYMGAGNGKLRGPILKKGAKIGNNASLLPSVIIGESAIVGAGAVVTKHVENGNTVVGNPARELKIDE